MAAPTKAELIAMCQEVLVTMENCSRAKDVKLAAARQLLQRYDKFLDPTFPVYMVTSGGDHTNPHVWLLLYIATYESGLTVELVLYGEKGGLRALRVGSPVRVPMMTVGSLQVVAEHFRWEPVDLKNCSPQYPDRPLVTVLRSLLPRLTLPEGGPGTRCLHYLCLDILELLRQKDVDVELEGLVQAINSASNVAETKGWAIESIDTWWQTGQRLLFKLRVQFRLAIPEPDVYLCRGQLCLAQAKIIALDAVIRECHPDKIRLYHELLVALEQLDRRWPHGANKAAPVLSEIVAALPEVWPDTTTIKENWLFGLKADNL